MVNKVYGLRLVNTERIRYVGQTYATLPQRLAVHKRVARTGKKVPVLDWIRKHYDEVEVVLLQDEAIRDTDEIRWIADFGLDNLLNMTPGGGGGPTMKGRKHRQESIDKLRSTKLGVPASSEHRKAVKQGLARNRDVLISCLTCRTVWTGTKSFAAHYDGKHNEESIENRRKGVLSYHDKQGTGHAKQITLCEVCEAPTDGSRTCNHKCGGILAWRTRRANLEMT